ncbi:MAG TPA: SDR family NAD(P)-dependent oxidoreductase [Candidatus Binatia bacterium]|nr:SDR family NAD(P)-dependent oxidoreductase [Candidatus Binatia bacterium]
MANDGAVCLVTGVGPGTGAAMARRFAGGGYRVAMLARCADRLAGLESALPGSRAFACDVADAGMLARVLENVRATLGDPAVVIHNAVSGSFGTILDVDPADLERNFRVNVVALLHLARALLPDMIKRGRGALVVTGNTSALRGKAGFAAFAPTKAAQRILAQSIARDVGPKGVHVACVVVDAVIDVPWTRQAFAGRPDDFFIQPRVIADEIWHVVHQERSAWSFDVELRPFGETW